MKCVLFLFVLGVAAILAEEDLYTTKYDNVNVDEILASDRLLNNYYNCIMDKGKCTPDGTELKSHLAEALATDCLKCSPAQRSGATKVLKYLHKNKIEMWQALTAKYDPTGVNAAKFESM